MGYFLKEEENIIFICVTYAHFWLMLPQQSLNPPKFSTHISPTLQKYEKKKCFLFLNYQIFSIKHPLVSCKEGSAYACRWGMTTLNLLHLYCKWWRHGRMVTFKQPFNWQFRGWVVQIPVSVSWRVVPLGKKLHSTLPLLPQPCIKWVPVTNCLGGGGWY